MKTYNGHRSWNSHNVALWLGSDEFMYSCILDMYNDKGLQYTIKNMVQSLQGEKTPDGAVYNPLSVRLAVIGLLEGVKREKPLSSNVNNYFI